MRIRFRQFALPGNQLMEMPLLVEMNQWLASQLAQQTCY